MPLTIPTLDDRKYQDLLNEALARIPVHTPEWTNFNKSDPGVTLIEIFAFMTENLLYRSNQIPERNRRKFLKLLGIPLQPPASARGIVTFTNERGPLETVTLSTGVEVRAGQIPFHAGQGLDVLPIEAQGFYKRLLKNTSQQLRDYYNQLYRSYMKPPLSSEVQLYETVPFPQRGQAGIDIGLDAVDGSLWIALLVRAGDKPVDDSDQALKNLKQEVRAQIGGKTLNLGIVPWITDSSRKLTPGVQTASSDDLLKFEIPIGGILPPQASERIPKYKSLGSRSSADVSVNPGVVQITLPAADELQLWDNMDPLEPGVKDFPPPLDDTKLNDRLITWLRIRPFPGVQARLFWAGINATEVSQRTHISNENLTPGKGTPDQMVVLSRKPVIPDSVRLRVGSETWEIIDDLIAAGPEVPVRDSRQAPGTTAIEDPRVKVFALDPESGEIRFGDGLHGARPPFEAAIRADYDYGVGRDGNVNAGSINSAPSLPAGLKVTNPIATWGGAEGETVAEGEKRISSYLRHRDRLVSASDFETIAARTPGVDISRVDVLPAFSPELGSNEPGDAAGAVTLMIVPKYDAAQPDAPRPDRLFLDTICRYVDSRRLVTTEVFLRGPIYKSIWVSVGINVVAGRSVAEVREAVKRALLQFLSPLPPPVAAEGAGSAFPAAARNAGMEKGWPLRKPVVSLELMAEATRVAGVSSINGLLLTAEGSRQPQDTVPMKGLQLPRVAGISVVTGDPVPIGELLGQKTSVSGATGQGPGTSATSIEMVPVPVLPEECK